MIEFEFDEIDQVATTWYSTVFYKVGSNKIIIWGDNKFGIKGNGNNTIELPGKIAQIHC